MTASTCSMCVPVKRGVDSPLRPQTLVWCSVSAGSLTASDRKSTRLNSSHSQISYAVFCLKKKKKKINKRRMKNQKKKNIKYNIYMNNNNSQSKYTQHKAHN